MYTIGRVCIKLAGRDAGREAVIVDVLDDRYVLVDGNVRRKKCNIMHLEPTRKVADIKKNASHDEVVHAFKALGFSVWTTKPKQKGTKPIKQRSALKTEAETPQVEKKKAKKVVKEAQVIEEKPAEKKETKPKAKKTEAKKEGTDEKKSPSKKKAAAKKE
jgi:large subunit ribosomal protein L14e